MNTQERIQKRQEYLKKKGGAYTRMSLATLLALPFTLATFFVLISLPLALYYYFHYRAWADYNIGLIKTLVGLLLLFGVFAGLFAWEARKAHRIVRQLPYVPPVTADTLPAEEVLVRGSEEPAQEQSQVLLRGTDGSTGTGEQELLRASRGQEEFKEASMRTVLLGLLLAVGMACIPSRSLCRQNLLLKRATRIDSLRAWSDNYFWQSNTQALSLTATLIDSGSGLVPDKTLSWTVIDSTTRRTQVLPSNHPTNFLAAFSICIPSPDRKWLLHGDDLLIVKSLDGSKQIKWAGANLHHYATTRLWMPDSRHFVQLFGNIYANTLTRAVIYNLDDPHFRHVVQIKGSAPVYPGVSPAWGEGIWGVTSNGHLLTSNNWNLKQGTVDFYDVDLTGDIAVPRHFTISLPQSGRVYEIALSPPGDQLAWGLQTIPSPHGSPVVGLWVSDIHGSHMHEIGSIKAVRYGADEPPGTNEISEIVGPRWAFGSWPLEIRWLPGGKLLSFIYKNALWTVPIDG